jgi:hypothetical protein
VSNPTQLAPAKQGNATQPLLVPSLRPQENTTVNSIQNLDRRITLSKKLLSPSLRAEVREELKRSWYFDRGHDYRFNLKHSWYIDDAYLTVGEDQDITAQLAKGLPWQLCNRLTAFYWLPDVELDGYRCLPTVPFGCFFKEWFT